MNVSGDIMKILLKKENVKLLLSAVIYLVLGVLFCVFLGQMVDFTETAICTTLLGITFFKNLIILTYSLAM